MYLGVKLFSSVSNHTRTIFNVGSLETSVFSTLSSKNVTKSGDDGACEKLLVIMYRNVKIITFAVGNNAETDQLTNRTSLLKPSDRVIIG